ncbi:MAG: hypothetical protein R3E08_08080 [Thiotrichaceae bacterium]
MITFAAHLLWLSGLLLLTACSETYQMTTLSTLSHAQTAAVQRQKPMAHLEAQIDSVLVQQSDSFPVQAIVVVKGRLPSKCNKIQETEATLRDNVFEIKLLVDPTLFTQCQLTPEPFEQNISLPIEGLMAGEYVVNVNNVVTSLQLKRDNQLHIQQ